MRRGRYKIFLGMAAGVGKTYRMLQEGHAEAQAGRDVVVGLVETHGREETAALLDGLEVVPRRRVEHRGAVMAEMDLPTILHLEPELCLIDELAHSNPPGVAHAKRYEDIEDVLDAGIDVFSTLNVQHLESLNDRVAELSGIRMRETVPDALLGTADEVVLIDLSPEALLGRVRTGKVYPEPRIDTALNNFFRIENLSALREVALRQVAEDVETRRLVTATVDAGEETVAKEAARAVGERLLALVEPSPGAQRLVRRAFRSAQRFGAELDLLWVKPPGRALTRDEDRSLSALRHLASVLGANLIVEASDDLTEAIAAVARRQGTTHILMGAARPARGLARLRVPLPQRLVRRLPGVDVRMVADRVQRAGEAEQE